MTEKDLKKLSRLELLEILLEETKENEKLKAEAERLKQGSELSAKEDEAFSSLDRKITSLENTLENIKDIILQRTEVCNSSESRSNEAFCSEEDSLLFKNMLSYYKTHSFLLCVLPEDIQSEIIKRFKDI